MISADYDHRKVNGAVAIAIQLTRRNKPEHQAMLEKDLARMTASMQVVEYVDFKRRIS